ncbi:MAG: sensor histidine kinase [Rhodocyclales bacterium]|nr:sensor histidine kinase [Rhodocyclales bacterium]
MTWLAGVGGVLVRRQRGLLALLLGVFHVSLLSNGPDHSGLLWWLADVGLFMLWQPFVRADWRLGFSALSSFLAILAVGVAGYGVWLLLLWAAFLAALVGGRVLFVERRATRIVYLLAFAYLLSAVLLCLVPQLVPDAGGDDDLLRRIFVWGGPVVIGVLAVIPLRGTDTRPAAGPVDFVYSLFIFLLIAVLVLGSLSFMVLQRIGYIQSLLGTLALIAAMLLLLGWAWNPRAGFGGIAAFFSRYLLTVGLPFEEWLQRLTIAAEEVREPGPFVDRVLQQMLDLPWVAGGEWSSATEHGSCGGRATHVQAFSAKALELRLYTHFRLSPTLVWHFRMLAELLAEYHLAKLRERELEQVGYLRAVYETGARLTHDVKNLLQSLNNLCYLAQSLDGERTAEIPPLMQKQLPLIVQRLELTLDKLRRPRGGSGAVIAADSWWESLCQRYGAQAVRFVAEPGLSSAQVPMALFDSVADNLIENALGKAKHETGIEIVVASSEGGTAFSVSDTGTPLPEQVAQGLFAAPVPSASGLGIGLCHAARQAEALGFELMLAENRAGSVRFELRRAGAAPAV